MNAQTPVMEQSSSKKSRGLLIAALLLLPNLLFSVFNLIKGVIYYFNYAVTSVPTTLMNFFSEYWESLLFIAVTEFFIILLFMRKKGLPLIIAGAVIYGVFPLLTAIEVVGSGSSYYMNFSWPNLLLELAVACALTVFCLPAAKEIAKKTARFWALPPALLILFYVLDYFNFNPLGWLDIDYLRMYLYHSPNFTVDSLSQLFTLIGYIALFFLLHALAKPHLPEKVKKEKSAKTTADGAAADADLYSEGYCSMGKHIALSLLTCGVWSAIWVYRTTKFLNRGKENEEQNPTSKLLLYLLVPFYSIYWFYKQGGRLDSFSRERGVKGAELTTLCLILGLLFPIAATIIMQDRINTICTAKPKKERGSAEKSQKEQSATKPIKEQTHAPAGDPSAPAPQGQSAAEELRSYKALLDEGIITKEEFEAKKKQLLGL